MLNFDIMYRPSSGFFGPRTFLLFAVVVVESEGGTCTREREREVHIPLLEGRVGTVVLDLEAAMSLAVDLR